MSKATLEIRRITDFLPDPQNANKGTQRGLSLLEDSISEDGAGRSLLATVDGVLIAGNKTQAALIERGIEEVIVVHTDGTRAVIVQRDDVKAGTPHAQRMGVRDNRTSEVGLDWDILVLDSLDIDLGDLFFDSELAEMGIGLDESAEDPGPQIDKAAELQEKWQTERGQVWEIGKHRLMCGDSTSVEDVGRLMGGAKAAMVWTDPPYNVASESCNYAADVSKAMNDLKHAEWDKDFDIKTAFSSLEMVMAADCAVYVCTSHWLVQTIWEWMQGWSKFWGYIVWCKPNPMPCLSKRHWTWATELIAYAVRGQHVSNFPDGSHALNWWDIPKDKETDHPTEKPVAVSERAILFSSDRGDIIADPFLGSGTTIVAAEQTGRICYGMEISPPYCAVTLERMLGMGLEPRLVGNES